MRRLAGVLLAAALFVSACSGDDEDGTTAVESGEEAQAENVGATEDDAATGGPDASLIAWGEDVAAHWDALQTRLTEIAIAFITALDERELPFEGAEAFGLRFDADLDWLAAHQAALDDAPPAPGVASLDPAYVAYVVAIDDVVTAYQLVADAIAEDREGLAAEAVQARESGEPGRYDDLGLAKDATDNMLTAACFDLAEVMVAEGLVLVNCTNSDENEAAAPGDVDPTSEPTEGIPRVALAAGTYDFTIFEQPLSLTLESEVAIRTRPRFIDMEFAGVEGSPLVIIATDELADPNTPAFESVEVWAPYPEGLGTWIDAAPLTVLETGTSSFGSLEAPWWQVDVDIEDALERGWAEFGFPIYDQGSTIDTGVAAFAGFPAILWQVDAPSGPVLVYTDTGALPAADAIAAAEAVLSTAIWG